MVVYQLWLGRCLIPLLETRAPTSLLIRGDNNNISNTIVFHHNFGYSWFSIGDNVSFSNHIMWKWEVHKDVN
jgi:hypothetical protein